MIYHKLLQLLHYHISKLWAGFDTTVFLNSKGGFTTHLCAFSYVSTCIINNQAIMQCHCLNRLYFSGLQKGQFSQEYSEALLLQVQRLVGVAVHSLLASIYKYGAETL